MTATPHLVDSNILIRLTKRDHADYSLVRTAVGALEEDGAPLFYTHQNMAEFWNASTRPVEKNGFGLTISETNGNAREIEKAFTLLPDSEAVYHEWRRLVVAHSVSGAQVHDARLVAAMRVHGVAHILTFNGRDFARYPGITAVHPQMLTENRLS